MKILVHLFLLLLFSPLFCATDWTLYKEETFRQMPQFVGWCTKEKAEKIMDFLYETKPKQGVEIGTFGGSTTFPIACALKFLHSGKLYTIDAWDRQLAVEGLSAGDPNISYWNTLDLPSIKKRFEVLLSLKRLLKWVRVISSPSEKAVSSFLDESLDFVYIDGNFSSEGSLKDVMLYFPKVKKGGYIWLNDADNDLKIEAVSFLMNRCTWIREKSLQNRCILLRRDF